MALTKVPGSRAQITDLNVSTSLTTPRVLLVGMKLPAGTLAPNTLLRIRSEAEGVEAAGEGSQLAQMVSTIFAVNANLDVTIVAMDAPAGAAASGTITYGGTATTPRPVRIQVEGETISIPVAIGDDGTAVALAADTELTSGAYEALHTASTQAAAIQTFTAKANSAVANEIAIEVLEVPPGVTAVVAGMSGGSGAPDVDSALAAVGGLRYHYVVLTDADSTNLADAIVWLNDRASKDKQLDSHAILAKRDTVGNLATLGAGLDTEQMTIFEAVVQPSNPWQIAAAVTATRATQTNPKLSLYNDDIPAIVAPPETGYLDPEDRETLLIDGIGTFHYVSGVTRVERFPTLSKTNDLGQDSNANYDAETKLTVSEVRQRHNLVLRGELGKILVEDASGTEYTIEVGGQITDPPRLRNLLYLNYVGFQSQNGWVSDGDGYLADLVVTITSNSSVAYLAKPRINGVLYKIEGEIAWQAANA